MTAEAAPAAEKPALAKSDAWTDLGLTLPIFVLYHLGVVFLPIRNAADPVTGELRALVDHNLLAYTGLTLGIGAALVIVLLVFGDRTALDKKRFLFIALEAALYAFLMRGAASYAVGSLALAKGAAMDPLTGLVLSLGAGLYEEITFRVGFFGLGAWLLKKLFAGGGARLLAIVGWAVVSSVLFSGWHYVGALGDPWDARSFVFRAACGVVLTTVYALRGFAPAVWTHAMYDVWVLVF
jgi:hypothetical protein